MAAHLRLAPGERWYVAMTLPHKERLAAANLANQGYRCFLPLQQATRRHARQFRTVLAPVFPRYIFIILDIERMRWRSVNGTIGVQGLVSDGERPLAAPPGIVETLLHSSDRRGALSYRKEDVEVGARVRLLAGPFAGSLGVLQRLDGPRRVQLMLELLSGHVIISLERTQIVSAG
ncbi:MAG: transcriptional activator RfaH [Hyphomicrobiales bacterium]|nr:transcriptional activator RfaH [Hyphomicrobiales bacterium]